ncbi:MAG: toll/interleukin-1 receptor domain-containing protein [Anaerolineae bacterium]|nr:toll/interleukin-1 receptor domain-containing protein [Anaerolineae bacterium]MCI0610118.1 toll/interleukin-1 receptor domain-containing protein [Anaerolineae bacterium]
MNKSENISKQERLAREFESRQKQYYDDVYTFYEKRDEQRLVIAFNLWEDRFIRFLEDKLPRMVDVYKTQTSHFVPLAFYGGSLHNFKLVKSDKVEAFLAQCIVDARKGNLDNYHIAPKKYKRASQISTKKKSNQKHKLRVFLCHSSNDKPQVRKLYKKLVDDAIDVWLDEKNLLPGQDWEYEISKEVANSDAIIICLSNNSVTKEGFVQKEIRFALDKAEEKPEGTIFIIPALLEECEVPQSLNKRHWVKLFEKYGYNLLLKALSVRATNLGLN